MRTTKSTKQVREAHDGQVLAWKFHLRSPKKEYSQQEALLDSGQEVSPALGPPVLQRLSS